MSHNKLRTEKTCLNCGAHVEERYCPQCGQENMELHDSTWHLLVHYIQDLVHYDGKTWHTMKNFVRKPGLVAVEYMEGKRRINIEPIRFYVFSSTVFFILFFYSFHLEGDIAVIDDPRDPFDKRMFFLEKEKKMLMGSPDTVQINALIEKLKCTIDSINIIHMDTLDGSVRLSFGELEAPDPEKSSWLVRRAVKRLNERSHELEERHQGNGEASFMDVWKEILHYLPQLIFLSLPFFAFNLKVLYLGGKRKNYVEHFIFSVYQYAFLYFTLAVYLIFSYMVNEIGSSALDIVFAYLTSALTIYIFVYLLLSMKRFYGDRWRYLLPRYFTLLFFTTFEIIILIVLVLSVIILI